MKVKDFLKLEKSGAMFIAVDADRRGYLTDPEVLIEADRNVIKQSYGDAWVVGFEPKGKKVTLYISQL